MKPRRSGCDDHSTLRVVCIWQHDNTAGELIGLTGVQATRPSLNGVTMRCSSITGPRTVIMGDAAHAVLPAMAQGANSALEDALVFSQVRAAALASLMHRHSCSVVSPDCLAPR